MRDIIQRYTGAAEWLSFFAVVLAAWAALFFMQPSLSDAEALRLYGGEFWAALCAPLTAATPFSTLFAMWALMSAAMMAPTFVPTLKTYRDLTHTEAANSRTFLALNAAYLAVWLGFAAIAALAQQLLAGAGMLSTTGASVNWGLTALLLAGAGAYQFSTIKDACLSQCRAPLMFFMQHWTPGVAGALRMGLRLGAVCVGCCWALMSLGFVGGVMNLGWMGVATLLMTLEKLPEIGRLVTRPLGIILLAGAVFSALQATGI
ncbi:MAG: DUF2182 domain-containing protein [Rhodobacteraceae bacterium]|nr:DUF2182 domain-containing protein [Paracoccaceae bacterium]